MSNFKRVSRFVFLSLIFVQPFLANSHAALSVGDLFQSLKDSGINYEPIGTICEEVDRLNLEQVYRQPQFSVFTGTHLVDTDTSQEIGEMDVLVFDNFSNEVIRVDEVKCWGDKSLIEASFKAKTQLDRLFNAFHSDEPLKIFMRSYPFVGFNKNHFLGLPRSNYKSISQDGGEFYGFNLTLGFSLKEMMDLRQALIDCQAEGSCKAPLHSPKHRRRHSGSPQ